MNREWIGSVAVERLPGGQEQVYSDGGVEQEMLRLAMREDPPDREEIRASWPVYYHFSEKRGNIVRWLPIGCRHRVLEIGSGCGAVSGVLAGMAGAVVGVDLSETRNRINAWRHRDRANLRLLTGNIDSLDAGAEFDWVTLIGVLEYAPCFFDRPDATGHLLALAHGWLKPGGRLVLAIENRFGLKYWAGCREDHSGRLFEGLQGYGSGTARTFARNELEELLYGAGFDRLDWYYPYPDYKFCSRLFSDSFLPQPAMLGENLTNYDQDRLYLFDERRVWQALLQEKQFAFFSNAFLVLAGKATGSGPE